jgi:hypothetical protein
MSGLRRTRSYRSYTYSFRIVARFFSKFTFDPLEGLGLSLGLIKARQKTLLWTPDHHWTWEPLQQGPAESRPLFPAPSHTFKYSPGSPSIELTDYSTVHLEETALHDTPAMAHSLFPPAISTRRPRNQSDASNYAPSLPVYERNGGRVSDETISPLTQRPSDVRRSRVSTSYRGSSDGRRSSEFSDPDLGGGYHMPLLVASHDEPSAHGVHSRYGYRRANSDPGDPPIGILGGAQGDGLGIGMNVVSPTANAERDM